MYKPRQRHRACVEESYSLKNHQARNRDSEAMQLKLDELIRTSRTAHNALLDIEELSEPELDRIKTDYERLASRARQLVRERGLRPDEPQN